MTGSSTQHYFEMCHVVWVSNSFLFPNTFMHKSAERGAGPQITEMPAELAPDRPPEFLCGILFPGRFTADFTGGGLKTS